MATTYLSKTLSTATSDGIIGTFSFWVKFSGVRLDGNDYMLLSSYADGNNRMHIKIDGDNKLDINSRIGGSVHLSKITNRRFRDTSGWYNIIVAIDTSQGTAANRCKVYVNGTQETSFATSTDPSQNQKIHALENSKVHYWGSYGGAPTNSAYALDGLMSHINFIDGTQAAPTIFGSTDSTTGEWKISTSPSVTYGNNGYFILKDGNSVTDQSGNSNNFTVGNGTLTNTEDCPSNVFATIDQQYRVNRAQSVTLSSGNTKVVSSGNNWKNFVSTLTMGSGKYYCEYKVDAWNGSNLQFVGVVADWMNLNKSSHPDSFAGNATNGIGYAMNGNYTYNNSDTSGGASYAANDIIGVALDATNSKLYFSKNGSWQFSGDPSNNSGGISIAANLNYFFVFGHYGSQGGSFNFGNGFFGTTAISSEGTNASGIGKFEYDVPTGFAALSTKGLNN